MFSQKETNNINKSRTPSRCREWERQRRLKFNDAISKLGELVLSIYKDNGDATNDKSGNAQFPKIEIIQKAIICLTNFTEEKSKLKGEILALEVKLQNIEKQKGNMKDVCVQVTLGTGKVRQNSKYLQLLMLKKSKNKEVQDKKHDKPTSTENSSKIKKSTSLSDKHLPKLLPLPSKKENTIVMLPGTPYIFPQRPILFPSATPTFVFLDTNLHSVNKPPIVNRNINDMTKTTMVNVLPISAYSHPLSTAKAKRNNTKTKNIIRKGTRKKKVESNSTVSKPVSSTESLVPKTIKESEDKVTVSTESNKVEKNVVQSEESNKSVNPAAKTISASQTDNSSSSNLKVSKELDSSDKSLNSIKNINENYNQKCISQNVKSTLPVNTMVPSDSLPNIKSTNGPVTVDMKTPEYKEDKNKETKLQNILQQPVCENVYAGNTRLELAEEFLAASPTAAFLMSFPLVSGNRADSPSEEATQTNNIKESTCRTDLSSQSFFEKTNQKSKAVSKPQSVCNVPIKTTNADKNQDTKTVHKTVADIKPTMMTATTRICNENPFLNLPLSTITTTSCNTLTDTSFNLEFDCNMSKAATTQSANYASSNNLFYKSDPFASVKNTVYSTSSLSSGHEYSGIGLYPCAVENYSSKNKSEFPNIDENLMKMNSSRLTYDIDLGWSHKSLDFVNCTTTSNSIHKENIFTSTPSTYASSYNPFNPEFHASLTKKDLLNSKSSTFSEAITSFYSQTSNIWSDDVSSIFANSSATKNMLPKNQQYTEPSQINSNIKPTTTKQYDSKQVLVNMENNKPHTAVTGNQHHLSEKYTKKSPSKMHINWMTSETRSSQNNCQQQAEVKENYKSNYGHINATSRKAGHNDNNYFPINMPHFPPQNNHEELQMWPQAKPAGTAEISIEPPPIHLPTLVGDLALGPHDKKRNDLINRGLYQDQNCSNFFSVTQLMNRSSDIPTSRSLATNAEHKAKAKHNLSEIVSDTSRKSMNPRDSNVQHCYAFGDAKVTNNFDVMNQFSLNKSKTNKQEKNSKQQKNNYSAEALIRGGTCSQKVNDNSSAKLMITSQKFGDFNASHDTSVAQVSHYPPLLDYSENSYVGQQYSTTLYNSTANTMPNNFYTNFMQNGSNLMPSSYTGGPFAGEFVDYNNQSGECNYANHKYDDIKNRNNANFHHDKSTRREAGKHKLDCNKKETSKKYPTKRSKNNTDSEEWGENLLWQNKGMNKRPGNVMAEELQFPNFIGNQMPTQYQPDFLNTHLMPSNVQNVGTNAHGPERASSTFPAASRSNFNLSTLFPEITMKVQ